MSYEEFKKLYERCTSGNCTPEEQKMFEEYRDSFDLSDIPWLPEFGSKEKIEKRLKEDLHTRISTNQVRKLRLVYLSAAAAILVLVLSGLFISKKYFGAKNTMPYELASNKSTVKPGDNKAILILADGRQIALDRSKKGELFTQNNVTAENYADSTLFYKKNTSGSFHSSLLYNVMSTPRGGKYQLVMSDGTKVWLNAASTIRFPVDFAKTERVVELSGEAYFEVVHDAGRPFKVLSAGQVVQVLGTHFNVNAYQEEGVIKTTLLEGRVEVYGKNRPALSSGGALAIEPNEQAIFGNGQIAKVTVAAEDYTAWKKGVILFRNADIQDVMRKISRWYDIDVVYQGPIGKDTYSGEIPRNASFSDVIKILTLDDIHIKVSGRKLIVSS
ncbi:FecR family protein [Mucilaginibacter sp. 22184]|uniref:FecR family protein n=1 Tax=Mucilaginibacter sp. 22184 TaxID=3453887 RepID=UPI003F852B95